MHSTSPFIVDTDDFRLGSGAGLNDMGLMTPWHKPDPRPTRKPRHPPWLGTPRFLFLVLAYLTETLAYGHGSPTSLAVKTASYAEEADLIKSTMKSDALLLKTTTVGLMSIRNKTTDERALGDIINHTVAYNTSDHVIRYHYFGVTM